MNRKTECHLAEGFSLGEKIWAQASFNIMGILGTVGIVLADWPWVIPYVLIYWYGIPGVLMRHLACPRCPHLYVHRDCLQFPAPITRWLVKNPTSRPFNLREKVLFLVIMLGVPLYPLYWLTSQPVLLTVFVACALAWYGGQLLHFCRRCRVDSCPFNRVRDAA